MIDNYSFSMTNFINFFFKFGSLDGYPGDLFIYLLAYVFFVMLFGWWLCFFFGIGIGSCCAIVYLFETCIFLLLLNNDELNINLLLYLQEKNFVTKSLLRLCRFINVMPTSLA